jgi:hypothetical protein
MLVVGQDYISHPTPPKIEEAKLCDGRQLDFLERILDARQGRFLIPMTT